MELPWTRCGYVFLMPASSLVGVGERAAQTSLKTLPSTAPAGFYGHSVHQDPRSFRQLSRYCTISLQAGSVCPSLWGRPRTYDYCMSTSMQNTVYLTRTES
ncbi:hypothetical protein, variant [Exophiala oligosperma]|uniref:Uncharacterized protein n=1 Tax=Exophiala oligosperma TaxID=215243 RepID=A0A0D2AMG6_9EURO|nr:uncharacterized protein PV06_06722 [Exophiala oligosperma]XP_016261353.1 hypothetical protein, variant [Exophiala oligosperma]KIW41136.1 hypothetical protein PV06_06722 [Exophiala oligosperma]KIW41137.1 hypothetical protein, variant [Exophiala oligosperma]